MRGRRKPPSRHFWRESVKSREREGRALAVFKLPTMLQLAGVIFVRQLFRPALEHVPMMQQPVEHGADRRHVGQQLTPVIHGAIGSQQRAGAFVPSHDDLQQILGSRLR